MYFIQEIWQECLNDKLFCSLGFFLLGWVGWVIIKYVHYYIRDNFGLKEDHVICELVKKYEWDNTQTYYVNYYETDNRLCTPLGFLEFTFYLNGEKIEHEVPLYLRDMQEGQLIAVTYVITRLSKKTKVRKVDLPCEWL